MIDSDHKDNEPPPHLVEVPPAPEPDFNVEDAVRSLQETLAERVGRFEDDGAKDGEPTYTPPQIELLERASYRGVPRNQDIRDVVIMETPYQSPALAEVRRAFAFWVKHALDAKARSGKELQAGTRPFYRIIASHKGAGKTSALAWVIARTRASAFYVRAGALVDASRRQHSRDRELIARCQAAQILCVDEFGRFGPDEDSVVRAYQWDAWEDGRGFILCTNLATDGHEGVADRLCDDMFMERLERQKTQWGLPWDVTLPGGSIRTGEGHERVQAYLLEVDSRKR